MHSSVDYADLTSDADWNNLASDLDPSRASKVLDNLLHTFRSCGARLFVEETAYIDRDFSSAYSAFYSSLYRQRSRFCRRIHFFASELGHVWESETKDVLARRLEEARSEYLGYVVIRPLKHAPVGSAIVSVPHFEKPGSEISVRSVFKVHLLGAEILVQGIPVMEQDTRTGSCAQATIWTAGRHFQNRYAMPWFSVTDITEAALKPTDSLLASSLPAGSDYLTDDNMVRALRAMGEHPIVYSREGDDDWDEKPERIIARYVDSGIPVIVALRKGRGVGHAVVAVGMTFSDGAPGGDPDSEPTTGDRVTHFLVNDDQRGAYMELTVREDEPGAALSSASPLAEASEPTSSTDDADDGYALKDAIFLIIPLPNKVFIKAEVAETLARDKVEQVMRNRAEHIRAGRKDVQFDDWSVDPDFYATSAKDLVARTYLTHGWKYKHRLMRNGVPESLKDEMTVVQLPRYIWVTEFSLLGDLADPDPCKRRVRAHVVIDASGSSNLFEDAVLLTHVPGIVIAQSFDPFRPSEDAVTTLRVLLKDQPYLPKVRGWYDFNECEVPPPSANNDKKAAA